MSQMYKFKTIFSFYKNKKKLKFLKLKISWTKPIYQTFWIWEFLLNIIQGNAPCLLRCSKGEEESINTFLKVHNLHDEDWRTYTCFYIINADKKYLIFYSFLLRESDLVFLEKKKLKILNPQLIFAGLDSQITEKK